MEKYLIFYKIGANFSTSFFGKINSFSTKCVRLFLKNNNSQALILILICLFFSNSSFGNTFFENIFQKFKKEVQVSIQKNRNDVQFVSNLATCSGNADAVVSSSGSGSSTCSPNYVDKSENAVETSSISLAVPSGAATGDLLIAAIAVDGTQSMTGPAGWTKINDESYSPHPSIFYRVVDGTESGSYTFTPASSESMVGTMLLYNQTDASPIDVIDAISENPFGVPMTAPSVTSTTDNNVVLRIAAIRDDSYGTFAGTTTRSGHSSDNDVSLLIGDEEQATAGATGTSDAAGARHTAVTLVISGGNCDGSSGGGSTSSGTILPTADYTINTGGTVNTCTGTFADSGDSSADYSDSDNQTMTFCSDLNNHISFTFEHFNTEATNDVLTIYDGNSTGTTQIGTYSGIGQANSPGVVTSSGNCLTFSFLANGSTTTSGWYASISCTGLASSSATAAGWTGYTTASACSSFAQIGGNVYEDIDNDGVQDSGEPNIRNVIVTLFDDNGQVGGTQTTDVNGDYTFTGLTVSTVYRVEFTVPTGFQEGPFGSNSGTAVQFIESGRCDANFGIIDVAHYCGETNPYFVIPCYAVGDPQHGSNSGSTGVARFRYNDSGNSPSPTYENYVTIDAVGSVWGVAFDGNNDRLYMSSILKRHAGLGPNGIGAIYSHNDGDANSAASLFYDFGSAAGSVANNGTRFPGSGSGFGQEGPCGSCDNIDPTTFAQAGKVGFGDIDINAATNKLYVSNLFDRKIYTIDLDNPTAGSATPLPGIPWLDNAVCSNGVARPWALEFRRGKLYVGVVCDASLSSCTPGSACSDLTAEIYSFDGVTWANEFSFTLDYYRKAYETGSDYFVKWIDDWNAMKSYVSNVTDANFGQPIIMDLEFDDDNSLIIGIGDRSGYQMGYQASPPTGPSSSTAVKNFAYGDILRASFDTGTGDFTLENNGSVGGLSTTNPTSNTGPGGKSFYWGDYWRGVGAKKYQGGIGSLMLLPLSNEIAFPMGDPIDYYSNGISWMNNTNGSDVKRLEVYQGSLNSNSSNFAKGSGVGDMVLFCNERPLEIGNIVWWDDDLDGLQDPSEPGIQNVTIELWTDPNGNTQGNNAVDGDEVKVAETTTDAFGRYIFSFSGNNNGLNAEDWSFTAANNVQPNTFYQVRIPYWKTDAGLIAFRNGLGYADHLLSPTQTQTGITGAGAIERDNNGYDNPGNSAGTVLTGDNGENDHNFDFAFGGIGGCTAPDVTPTANIPCDGESLNLMAAVSGGVTPYVYNWSGPNSFTANTQNPTIAAADSLLNSGIYYLTVTDDAGCQDTTHIHIAINKATISVATTAATCGSSDGAIDITINGLTPYAIDWDNNGTGQTDDPEDLTGLATGTYNVTVTDANGCLVTSAASVGSTGSVTLAETHVNETCTAGNGSIDLTITGSPTSITWSNNETTEDISGLSAGTYSVTVTNAANCDASLTVILTNTPGLTASATQVNTTCGDSNGSIDLTVNGGTAPYTYQWDNDGTADSDDVQDISGLAAGTYNVTVTDATLCTAMVTVTLTDTAGPTLATTPSNETCGNSNGSVNLTVSNGTPPYTYAWNNGLMTEDVSGLGAGTFMVTVTDANNCTATTMATVGNTEGPTLSVTPTNSTDCIMDNGSINLTVSGGAGPYTYDWDNDGYEMPDNDTEDLFNLPAGSYMVIVTDANNCQSTISATILNTTDPILSVAITDPTTCLETGSVDLTVTGGNGPFTYDWSNDGLGEGGDTEDLSGLAGDVYKVIITGADGCTATENVSIAVIRDPIINETIVLPTCGNSDGSITLAISDPDGMGAYTYAWSNGATTQNLTSLPTGNYSVTITNGISCTAIATYSLAPTAAPILTLIQNNPNCGGSDGNIDLTIMGGTPPYDIDWDNNGTGQTNDSEDLSGLSAGDYGVTVTDNGGCQSVGFVTLISSEVPVLNATTTSEECIDADGAIDLTIMGVAPFQIDWDNNGTGHTNDPEDLTGLSAGNYTVTVTDANGCVNSTTVTVGNICNNYSIGNQVFTDTDNSGDLNDTETGIDGVELQLLNSDGSVYDSDLNTSGDQPLTVTTANGGYYRFDGLSAGNYIVEVLATNFSATNPLENLISSTGPNQEVEPDDDNDLNDNGLDAPVSGAIRSGVVTLATPEPSGEAEPGTYGAGSTTGTAGIDLLSNLTIDFGFYGPCNLTDAGETSETCNDNGTNTNPSDDYITFSLNPVGTNLGATYSVTASNSGTVTFAAGGAATGVSYGSATAFRLQNGSADGFTTFTITVTDIADGTCTATTTVLQSNCFNCPAQNCGTVTITINN